MLSEPDEDQGSKKNKASIPQLVLQAQAGDLKAFEDLYKRYFKQLCNYLTFMVGNNGIGCEIAQETFLKAWENLLKLREPATFVGWLYRIAINLAHDHQRRTQKIRILSFDVFPESCQPSCSGEPLEEIEVQDCLKKALLALPWEQRACLILYHLQDVSKDDIALFVGIKKSSVNTYLSAGLKKLRRLMEENT